ncbi:MAG: TonB-dependent receptor plug domain-containing protein [Verrucomicrobia bacterium]|nr:TonB-dependent receptor plug domain-containing protein [Verrucomicrobiota bacterium]
MHTLPSRVAAGCLILAGFATAQIVPVDRKPAQDETVQLSPFEVSAGAVQGYATTSATSASRLAVPITEIPTNVIVLNETLIEDVLAVGVEDTLSLIGGVSALAETTSAETNQFSSRGYTSASAQRDGFTDLLFGNKGGFNYAFVERIEYVKGPAGILYGQHTPGGMLNLVSKRPLSRPRTKVGVMAGSYGFYRGDLDTSGHLGAKKKFGYRLAASYMLTHGPLNHPGELFKDKGFLAINPMVRYRTDQGIELWAWTGFIRDRSPRLRRITKTFQSNGDGIAHPHPEIMDNGMAHNVVTNYSQVNTDNYELGATKRFDLGPLRLDVRLLGRTIQQFDSGSLVTTSGSDVYVDKAGAIIGTDGRTFDFSRVLGNLGGFYRPGLQTTGTSNTTESSTYATDFGFAFKLGPTQHKLLVFATYNRLEQVATPGINGRVYTVTTAAALEALGAERVGTVGRVWLYPLNRIALAGITPERVVANATGSTLQNTTKVEGDQTAYGFQERLSFWQNRAFLVAGARFTDNETSNQVNTAAATVTTDRSWSDGYGALYKAYAGETGDVALFYNANETFIPVYTLDQRLATFGQKFPNRIVSIREYGVKVDLLKSRLVATASVYDMDENNVLLSQVDEDGTVTGVVNRSYSVPKGKRTTHGWEVDLSYHVMPGLNTVLSYGDRTARQADGTIPYGQPDQTFSALARYEVQRGPLRNASLLWSYTWWGESILSTRTNWRMLPGAIHNAVLGYRWKSYRFGFRIENVLDHLALRPSVNETAVGVTNHRNFRLSVGRTW